MLCILKPLFNVASKPNIYIIFFSSYGVGYACHGNLSEWTKCINVVDQPTRTAFLVPENFKKAFDFLYVYSYKSYPNLLYTNN